MKTRFSTVDIAVVTKELRSFYGMRVVNVYDIDHKTYLIRLGKPDDKTVILLESGTRIHNTEFDWPKNAAPSGFSMKLRKHIKGRRLEYVQQLGVDRIVDLQFGSGEAAYHVIAELYDRGNIVLTDYEFTILNILRPRTDTCQDVRFAVRETYPISAAKEHTVPTDERLTEILLGAQIGDVLKKVLIPHLDYGPAITEHCLISAGFPENVKLGKGFTVPEDIPKLQSALQKAEALFEKLISDPVEGVIIQKTEKRAAVKDKESEEIVTYDEFHPMLFCQFEKKSHASFPTFNKAVDEFFSKLESQKLDMKMVQQEKSALKKLENIKKDHEKRIDGLQKVQETDINKGRLIELNLQLVDQAILIVRSAIANQIDWVEIQNLVKEAQLQGDPVAATIKGLSLDANTITLLLRDPYWCSDDEFTDDEEDDRLQPMKIDIDLSLSAYANSRKYFEKKKHAAKKEQKTIDASAKALKSAEKKTKETLKEVATAASINKARKTYWFEKFLWFITSENYLVIGGRDQQQNELIVKRYMRQGDLYVHADLHGASSCVLKNPTGEPVPPKSLNEAGTMAICNSVAWDAKVVTSAWWVYHDQVSKTAPSGEYLSTGSFMIRGKKNYLPPSHLVYGFGILFKLEEGSVARHKGERKVFTMDDDAESIADSIATESDIVIDTSSVNVNEDESDSEENKCGNEDDNNENDNSSEEDNNDEKDVQENDRENEDNEEDSEKKSLDKNMENQIDEQNSFPDTSITLQHVKGDKYELQRSASSVETLEMKMDQSDHSEDKNDRKSGRLSARQRREMRKAKKGQQNPKLAEEEDKVSCLKEEPGSEKQNDSNDEAEEKASSDAHNSQQSDQPKQQPMKRGQRSKMKKMKEKYADQDEEERQLRMEILASGGAKKEEKKSKGKKSKDSRPLSGKPANIKQQLQQQKARGVQKGVNLILQPTAQIVIEDLPEVSDMNKEEVSIKPSKEAAQHESDDEKPEEELKSDDTQMLESLTGIPLTEDELLFAIPVCAPYNALNNYKYKVKLMPGSTRRGKAAKTAINMFQHEKVASTREKDLLRILKDADTSRNIPGKVKVAAPNLHRKKGK